MPIPVSQATIDSLTAQLAAAVQARDAFTSQGIDQGRLVDDLEAVLAELEAVARPA